jgi:hypothetical protein
VTLTDFALAPYRNVPISRLPVERGAALSAADDGEQNLLRSERGRTAPASIPGAKPPPYPHIFASEANYP